MFDIIVLCMVYSPLLFRSLNGNIAAFVYLLSCFNKIVFFLFTDPGFALLTLIVLLMKNVTISNALFLFRFSNGAII